MLKASLSDKYGTAVGPIREMGSVIMRGVIVLLFHMHIILCD